jgi:hypothetical protein
MTLVLMGSILLAMGLLIRLIGPGTRGRDPRVAASVKTARVAYTVMAILGAVVLTVGLLTIVLD